MQFQFQYFVHSFIGGTPEALQYLFDIPALLKIEAPIEDDPNEDPCEDEEIQTRKGRFVDRSLVTRIRIVITILLRI